MIPVAELRALQAAWRIRDDVIEKDYALGWFLAAIAAEPALRATWIFKGGTALRKCYLETYRFSEDLDFTVIDHGPQTPEELVPVFQRIAAWLQDRCGLEIAVDAASFRTRKNRRGRPTAEGKLAYRGPRNPPSLPKLKIDITSDEVVPSAPSDRPITHPYSDGHDWPETIRCYSIDSIVDLFAGEVTSDLKHRPEGIRLKHYVAGNSVKIYDKQATVLRAETTINEPRGFKVYRTAEGDDTGLPTWRMMRKGVADMTRRVEVSQAVNDRYLDALASCEDTTPLGELTVDVCRPVTWNGRRARALHPWSPDDLDLLRAIGRGEFLVNGFRNADLAQALHGAPPQDITARRRQSSAVTRRIRLLRAHGLVHKRPKSHRYVVSPKGHRIISALLAAYQANTESLSKLAS